MKPVTVNPIPGASLNAWKIGAVFLPFGLALLYSAHHYVPSTLFTVLGLTLLGLLIAVWIAGLAKTFPLWSLPSLGMLFFIIYFFLIYASALQFVYSFNGGWSKDLSQGIRMLLSASLVTLLIAALAFFSLLQLIPRWREQVRQDWTQLSFFLYGLAILPLFMNDEFTHLWAYQATGLLLLALGAGLYLIAPHRWQRILVLFVPVVLCQALFSLGLYQTYPLESWISLVDPNQRLWEALYPLSDPLPFLLLLPALVPIIPWKGNPEPVTYGEPARAEES